MGKVGPYYTRPMSPARSAARSEIVDAATLAARGETIDCAISLAALPRLAEWSLGNDAVGRLAARFHMVHSRVGVTGRVTATLGLTCQRCLGTVSLPVSDEFHVVVVDDEAEMTELPEQQDAIVADAGRLDLAWLLEEQLLLALPLVPMHATAQECKSSVRLSDVVESELEGASTNEQSERPDTQRPFADLKRLMAKDGKSAK